MKQNKTPGYLQGALALIVLVCSVYHFHPAAFDNAASRLDLAFSLALRHSIDIDPWHGNTIDKAYLNGHYYCDKAPGVSFAAAPLISFLATLAPDKFQRPDDPAARFLIVLFIIAIPSALSFVLLMRLMESISGANSAFPAIVYALGTIALPYAGLFYSHQFCAALLISAFYLWYREQSGESERTIVSGLLCGLLAGYAAISEYPAALPAGIIVAVSFMGSRSGRHRAALALGFIAPLLLLAAYNYAAWGHPFRMGYSFEVHSWFREEMGRGIGGVTYPRISSIAALLFSPHKGLFWGQAFLLLAAPGTVALWKAGGARRVAGVVAAICFIVNLLVNSAYYEPWGGFAPGPRFLVLALPFAAILASAGWASLSCYAKGIAGGAGIFSIIYFLIITAIEPHVPHIFASPLFQYALPLIHGGYQLRNMGAALGLGNPMSLIPLILLTATAVAVALHHDTRERDPLTKWLGGITGLLAISVLFMATSTIIRSDDAHASYYLGATYGRNAQYERAAAHFADAVASEPGFQQAWYRLGIAKMKRENYNEAIYCFEESLILNKSDVQSRVSLAAALIIKGDFEKADAVIHNGLLEIPRHPALIGLQRTSRELQEKSREE